jgi:hypothetical protein
VLPNILEARAEYDDDIHQYFTMVVDKDGQRETVRGVRIGTPCRKLELCQFQAPPGFLMMRGEWRFEPATTGTKVSAERTFAMVDSSREDAAASMLAALLAENLSAFDAYLTGKPA